MNGRTKQFQKKIQQPNNHYIFQSWTVLGFFLCLDTLWRLNKFWHFIQRLVIETTQGLRSERIASIGSWGVFLGIIDGLDDLGKFQTENFIRFFLEFWTFKNNLFKKNFLFASKIIKITTIKILCFQFSLKI